MQGVGRCHPDSLAAFAVEGSLACGAVPDETPRAVDDRFDPDQVDATLASTLDSLDDAENYRNWIVDLARPHLVGPILEVGAGHGTFTESFATIGEVTAVEPGGYAAEVLASRYAHDERVTAVDGVVADVFVEKGGHLGPGGAVARLVKLDTVRVTLSNGCCVCGVFRRKMSWPSSPTQRALMTGWPTIW